MNDKSNTMNPVISVNENFQLTFSQNIFKWYDDDNDAWSECTA
jgi:hypothetical protein